MIEIIAEIGQNHNGDLELAKKMIRQAKACGADVVKFQLYDAKKLFSKEDNPWYDYNCQTELSRAQVEELFKECQTVGIEFMASVFDLERLGWLESLGVKRYKIASRSINDEVLLNGLCLTGKPLLVSLGYWQGENFPTIKTQAPVSFLHCISHYPTALEELNFQKIDFNKYDGFSDHTVGINASLTAMARGAKVIEKHFTLDRQMFGPDHSGSATPEELKAIVDFRNDFKKIMESRRSIKTTVYIPSHNYGRYLEEAINSVLRQSSDDWELLLINDGSTDNTQEIMDKYRGDQRVRVFETPNIGLPAVANLALKEAQGEYLIRLDGDDIFDENILLVLERYLGTHPEDALVFGDYYLIDDGNGIIRHERKQKVFAENNLLDMPANGACTLIRRKILQEVGGYREDLGAQDGFDIWTKIIKNYRCGNVNVPLFYYRKHGHNLTDNKSRILAARLEIKRDAVKDVLNNFRPIIAIIPCRKNYDFLPDLWQATVGGQSLLDIAIKNNLAVPYFDKIIVASDNLDIKEKLVAYQDSRLEFFSRRQELTEPSRNLALTIEEILKKYDSKYRGLSVISYIGAPFNTAKNLEESLFTLVLNEADSAFAVAEVEDSLYKRSAGGLVAVNNQSKFMTDFDVVYRDAQVSLALSNNNLKTGSLLGNKVVNFAVKSDEAFFIHNKKELEIANTLKKTITNNNSQLSDAPPLILEVKKTMKFGVILAARTSSHRLPGKALLPLMGMPIVPLIIRRLKTSKLADKIVFATSNLPEDDLLAEVCQREGAEIYRGSLEDVVGRFVGAAQGFDFDYVVRVTGDEPFVDGAILDYVIEQCLAIKDFDLVTTKPNFPHGLDFEVYPKKLLEAINQKDLTELEREHLLPYIYNRPQEHKIVPIDPPAYLSGIKEEFLLDTIEDYQKIQGFTAGISDIYVSADNLKIKKASE